MAGTSSVEKLCRACEERNILLVTELLTTADDIDINSYNDDDYTPLHLASRAGSVEVVEILLQNGADVNVNNMEETTALLEACKVGSVGVTRCLLNHGATMSVCGFNRATFRDYATKCGLDQLVSMLEKHYPEEAPINHAAVINMAVEYAHVCEDEGQLAILDLLLGHGVDINCHDNEGVTSLHTACQYASMEVIQYLVDKGVDLEAKDNEGKTCVHYSCLRESAVNSLTVVRYLGSLGVNIDTADKQGNSPLHLAVTCCLAGDQVLNDDAKSLVSYFVDSGADLKRKGLFEYTPLFRAVARASHRLVTYFLSVGADMHDTDSNGWTLLHCACAQGHTVFPKSVPDCFRSKTPIGNFHTGERVIKVIDILLDGGLDINCVDSRGRTPLMEAACNGDMDIIQYLLGRGARVVSVSHEGWTPVKLAYLNRRNHAVVSSFKSGASLWDKPSISGQVSIFNSCRDSESYVHIVFNLLQYAIPLVLVDLLIYAKCEQSQAHLAWAGYRDVKALDLSYQTISDMYVAGDPLFPCNNNYADDNREFPRITHIYDRPFSRDDVKNVMSLYTFPSLLCLCRAAIRRHLSQVCF